MYMCMNVCMCIVLLWTVDICALGDGEILFVYRRGWWRDFGRVDFKWLFGCEEGGMMQVPFMYVLILRKFFCFGGEWGNFFFLANFNRNEGKRRKMLREYRYLLLIIRIK